jgi:S-(hydroxymethyl)glutathione dehydrogenase/alcohol dehydrogenase
MPVTMLPMAGGHEGAGVVVGVGPNTEGFEVGDHVVLSFLPGCGRCHWCASGMQNLCDMGAALRTGSRPDGTFRMHLPDGDPVGQFCCISTFSTFTAVSTYSAVKVPKELPLDKLCLIACGVPTGWGAAVNMARVTPGQSVIVMGVGGVGINAVQGAARAGASYVVAVDPVELKRTTALSLGATHAFADIAEAADFVRSVTNGQGANAAIVTVGIVEAEHIAEAFAAIGKAGVVVLVGIARGAGVGIPIKSNEMISYQKRIQGTIYGGCSPSKDIPLFADMYRTGGLHLDELVTRTYDLDHINDGYDDLRSGKLIRGVITFA